MSSGLKSKYGRDMFLQETVRGPLESMGIVLGLRWQVQGVVRDSILWLDGDGDGVLNIEDECPNEDSSMWDNDFNGCIDDGDGDGVKDPVDECPTENSTSFDQDGNGCIDDSDFDGVLDNVDQCQTEVLSPFWPVDAIGCRPIDTLPTLDFLLSPDNGINGMMNW